MKRFEKNLTVNFTDKSKSALIVFSMLLTFGIAARAQSVNDDLKPRPAKPAESKSKPKPATRPAAKTVGKKPAQTKPAIKKTNSTRPQTVRSAKAPTFSETPIQIINRFMNFQQSDGVTDKDWKSVLAQTAQTLETNPNNTLAKAQSLIAQGYLAYNQKNYAMAAIHFNQAQKILPQSSLPNYSLGKTYLANGQAEAAEKAFKLAAEKNKNFALAHKGTGDAQMAQGKKDKATKSYKRATEISIKAGNMPL